MGEISLKCKTISNEYEYKVLSKRNYEEVRRFTNYKCLRKADNPTLPKGQYFGVCLNTRGGRVVAYIGDYIVKLGERDFVPFAPDVFDKLFKI